MYIKGSLKWIVEESEVHFCFSGPIDVAAECLVISVAFALCLIVVKKRKKKKTQRDYSGFKESREAAINVILTLGLDVNEMGDHIPNPKTHSHYTKLFFQLSPKRKKGTNCEKSPT